MSQYNHVHIRGIIVKKTVAGKNAGSLTIACQAITGRPTEPIELNYLLKNYKSPRTTKEELIGIIDELVNIYANDKKLIITNHPIVQYNNRTATRDIDRSFSIGDRVIIDGHLESYRRYDAGGNPHLNLFIYADTIKFDTSKFESYAGIKGRIFPASENDVYLTGTIAAISRCGNSTAEIKIKPTGEANNLIPVIRFKITDSFMSEYHVGDNICLMATIQSIDTRNREASSDGKKPGTNFHRIVISNMAHCRKGVNHV